MKVAHRKAQAVDDSNIAAVNKAPLKDYLKILNRPKFVPYLFYMKMHLGSLEDICKNLQMSSNDL